jgi:hypothetical protein
MVLTGFLFTLRINPRINDVEDPKSLYAKLQAWKTPENVEKLSALEVKFSKESGRNLARRADAVESSEPPLRSCSHQMILRRAF